MNVVFVGGGSLRLLPILRGVFKHHKGVFENGEIRLCDLNPSKAELVGRMIMKTPEYRELSGCEIRWGDNLDEMLKGADLLYVTMAIGNPLNAMKAQQACEKLGFIGSDQLSPEGAVLSLIGGKTILGFARKMEQHCPNAKMLIFANPVAVYSGMVNNHTKIKAYGICGGYANHSYDLTRIIFGENGRREGYDINAAGVNHCSLIMNGTYRGEDIFELMGKAAANPAWRPPAECSPMLQWVLRQMVDMYKKFGTIIFSTEFDGFAHFFYEESLEKHREHYGCSITKSDEEMQADADKHNREIQAIYDQYKDCVDKPFADEFWNASSEQDRFFGLNETDVTLPILKAMAGLGAEKIVASLPNNGTVVGFKDRTVLEYSLVLDGKEAVPAGKFEIPDAFHGLLSSLATHQTLLGDAIATRDPKILLQAFYAYPIFQNSRASRLVFTELMDIFAGEYPEELHQVTEFLKGTDE